MTDNTDVTDIMLTNKFIPIDSGDRSKDLILSTDGRYYKENHIYVNINSECRNTEYTNFFNEQSIYSSGSRYGTFCFLNPFTL